MDLTTKVKNTPNVAIFSRNHKLHLDSATKESKKDPLKIFTFQSDSIWRSAEIAVIKHGPRPIYFLPIGEKNIRFIATLEEVVIEPRGTDTKRLEKKRTNSTSQEGELKAKTLYVISNCRELDPSEQVPFIELEKVKDNKFLSPDFKYSYSIVYIHSKIK